MRSSRLTYNELQTFYAVMSVRIGERHASACRYKNEVPEGSRRSARLTHFWPRDGHECPSYATSDPLLTGTPQAKFVSESHEHRDSGTDRQTDHQQWG